MNLILPIIFFAAVMGLFARRITTSHWWALGAWISLVLAYHYFKH